MKYYKRGKTNLRDDLSESFFQAILDEVEKLPEEEQAKKAKLLLKAFTEKLPDVLANMKDDVIKKSNRQVKKALKADEKDRKGFERRLYRDNKTLIEGYKVLLGVCVEAVQNHRELTHKTLGEQDHVFPFMIRLHARALRIANEILTLVRSGYGTGALVRWRALHEDVVVLAYVREQGMKAIKAMSAHEAVAVYKEMKEYQKHCQMLGYEPYTAREMYLAKAKYDRRIRRYGRGFKQDYGWASLVSNGSINNFAQLEEHVGKDHLRPYYKLSSLGVHTQMGSLRTGEEFHALQGPDGVALIGPADYGFEDAVSLSLLTTSYATIIILTYNVSMGSLLWSYIILELEQKAQDSIKEATWTKDPIPEKSE